MIMPIVRRRFLDLGNRQIHYREAGVSGERPIILLHGAPSSSAQLAPMISLFGQHRPIVAPDIAGYGDSAPLPIDQPTIANFADDIAEFLAALGLNDVDIYGFHTGACVASELAIRHPHMVHHVILEGVGLYENDLRQKLIDHYAAPIIPDQDGAYLIRAFHFLRDQAIFWPWFDKSRAARRDADILPAPQLQRWMVELLKASDSYHLGYRAAFAWDAEARLALMSKPYILLSALDDPLATDCGQLAKRLQAPFHQLPEFAAPNFLAERWSIMDGFYRPR